MIMYLQLLNTSNIGNYIENEIIKLDFTSAEFAKKESNKSDDDDDDKDTLNNEDSDNGDENVILVPIENNDASFDFISKKT